MDPCWPTSPVPLEPSHLQVRVQEYRCPVRKRIIRQTIVLVQLFLVKIDTRFDVALGLEAIPLLELFEPVVNDQAECYLSCLSNHLYSPAVQRDSSYSSADETGFLCKSTGRASLWESTNGATPFT